MYGATAAKYEKNLTVEKMLIYAIQDEFLAREEYAIAIETFGDEKPFTSIIESEVIHIKWLKELFIQYNFEIPKDKAFEYLHTPESFSKALLGGVEAEIANIAMYDSFLAHDLPEDVRIVFTKLRDASKGHLFVLKRRSEAL